MTPNLFRIARLIKNIFSAVNPTKLCEKEVPVCVELVCCVRGVKLCGSVAIQ